MRQGGIQISSLLRHLHLGLEILSIANLTHQVHTIGNHYQYHTHVLGKREQKITEVLTLNHWVLLIELLNAVQAMKNARNLWTIFRLNCFERKMTFFYFGDEVNSLNSITLQADFFFENLGCLSGHLPLFLVCKCEQFCHNLIFSLQSYTFLGIYAHF